ncbi:MAG: peptidyl-alpha-hydroxyglycine alpha-amidating lyase family protein [Gemmataceae bacterium]
MTKPDATPTGIVGSDDFVYQADDACVRLPEGIALGEAVGVAVDSQDQLYVLNRGGHQPVMVFDRAGNFIKMWGAGQFVRPHGIFIGPDDSVYLTDDRDHTVRKYSPDGELLMTLGTRGCGSDSGVVNADYRTIQRPAPPFNLPTNLAIAPKGLLYVSDGYGNCCIHKFAADGKLLLSWGEPGDGPGQFQIPHGIGVDSVGIVVVADRENSRLQWFTPDGEYIDEWTDVARPCDVIFDEDDNIYVAELGWQAGTPDPRPHETGGRVSIFNREGTLLARWGGGKNPYAADDFIAPHDIWIDSRGDLYVGEVTLSAAVARGLVNADCPSLRKFVKQ